MSIPGSVNPLFLGAAGQATGAGGYLIERSLRFNSADSAYLSRTPASSGNRKTWTFSFWVKRTAFGSRQTIIDTRGNSDTTIMQLAFNVSDQLDVVCSSYFPLVTSQVFRDPSAWYHIAWSLDTTQATASNRMKLYANGAEITNYSTDNRATLSQNTDQGINIAQAHHFARQVSGSNYGNYYLADIHFIDGQALDPTSFGEFDTNGIWQPIDASELTYGTNGFHLDFADNASTTTIGYDAAGSNDWTANNLSVTAGSGNDSLVDVPTNGAQTDTGVGGEVRGNYATFNPTESSTSGTKTLTNGNLDVLLADANAARLTIPPIQASGKYQWEITIGSKTAQYYQMGLNLLSMVYATGDLHATFRSDGNLSNTLSGSWSGTGVSYTSGDVITVAYDNSNNSCAFYKNGVYSATFTLSGSPQASLNFGVFYGGSGNTNYTLNAGQRAFAHPVSGFKALCTANLPAPVVTKPSDVMDVKLYTGNGSTQTISGLGFSPDLVWIKNRNISGYWHELFDAVRGVSRRLFSNDTSAEDFKTGQGLTSFNSDGFTLTYVDANDNGNNSNGNTFVAWTWDAGSSTVTNTSGSISSQVRANASAGFSVVTWTGTGATGAVGHGLGAVPSLIICKSRAIGDTSWDVYHQSLGNTGAVRLHLTSGFISSSLFWNNTSPTSSVFTVTSSTSNNPSGTGVVAYCFAPVAGYSSFGSYTGNGSTDGSFTYLGFLPKLILIKRTDTTSNWTMLDTLREGYNVDNDPLYPNLSNAEGTTDLLDITSNGFKLRSTDASVNASGGTYIFAAWASNPFQYSRAR